MGIPHLITYLRPYAIHKSLDEQTVVIDGPGLAYHIYHICLSARPASWNAFEAAPSYAELGQAVVAWLDGLRKSGSRVEKIYFDGFLPPSKFKVRLDRLSKLTAQLTDYYQDHPELSFCSTYVPVEITPRSLFARGIIRTSSTKLPPPPLLVPSIIEALLDSKLYKRVTEVVPSEADICCARYLKENGGIVFTGDSDLLIHDLGSQGVVSFFQDISTCSDGPVEALYTEVYHPVAIAHRLSLPKSNGLHSLAFEITMDCHGTFRKLLQQAKDLKAIKAQPEMYEEFAMEYAPPKKLEDTGHSTESALETQSCLRCLDPRISEVVLQFPRFAKIAGFQGELGNPHEEKIHAFLPFLLDCATLTNAWEISTYVRQLAYGLINLVVPDGQQRFAVTEHRKQQKTANGREWQLPDISGISEACMGIVNLLDQLGNKLPNLTEIEMWIAVTVYQDIAWASSMGKRALAQKVIQRAAECTLEPTINLTWEAIHFLAQINGSYYSFRILQQITTLVIYSADSYAIPEAVFLLQGCLNSLPALRDAQDLSQTFSVIGKIESAGIIRVAYDILGIPQLPKEPHEAPKKTRKKRKGGKIAAESSGRSRPSNPFEILSVE